MVRAYGGAWRRIDTALGRLQRKIVDARQAGETVDPVWLLQQDRYRSLLAQVEEEAARFGHMAAGEVRRIMVKAAQDGIDYAGQAAAAAIVRGSRPQIDTSWSRLPKGTIGDMVGALSEGSPLHDLFAQYGVDARQAAEAALIEGVVLGENPRKVARRLRASLAGQLSRAQTVARTEMMRAWRESTRRNYQANGNIVKAWVWHSATDSRSCPACWAMHGTEFPLHERLDGHPNCFPAGVVVSGPAPQAATSRWFAGELVHITTSDGGDLAVTPQHPILTTKGWIPAHLICEGDHVIRHGRRQGPPFAGPHDHNGPALIEDVTESLRRSGRVSAMTVPSAPEQFHGDGLVDSHVDVVRTDRSLKADGLALACDPRAKLALCRPHAALAFLASSGAGGKLLGCALHASDGVVGRLGVAATLLGAAALLLQAVSVGAAPAVDPRVVESEVDDAATHAVSPCEGGYRLTGLVEGDQLVKWHGTPSRVIRTRREVFAGHVFNLETSGGWYFANGIAVHNCRCAMVPKTRTFRDIGLDVDETRTAIPPGGELFERLSDDQKRKILGPAAYEAYRDGAIRLADLVDRRHDPRWGSMRTTKSLRRAVGDDRANEYRDRAVEAARQRQRTERLTKTTPTPGHTRAISDPQQIRDLSARATQELNRRSVLDPSMPGIIELKKKAASTLADTLRDNGSFVEFAHRVESKMGFGEGDPVTRVVAGFIHQWARNSDGPDAPAHALQASIGHVFGLKTPRWWSDGPPAIRRALTAGRTLYAADQPAIDAFTIAQYEATQAWLRQRGIDRIFAWRGMALETTDGFGSGPWGLQPASSFTSDYRVAIEAGFAGYSRGVIIGGEIPADRILGCPHTGFGCFEESEWVVLGGPGTFWVRGYTAPEDRPRSLVEFLHLIRTYR